MILYGENVKTIDFSETIVVVVGRRSKLNEYVNLYEYQRSRSFIDLGPSSLRFNIFKLYFFFFFFFLETAGPPCTNMVKTIKNLLVWNQKVDYLETWYLLSANRLLPNLFKWWHWYDLDLFYGKVIFVPLCFLWEKDKNNIFLYNIKVGRCSQTNDIKGQRHSLTFIQGHSGSNFP